MGIAYTEMTARSNLCEVSNVPGESVGDLLGHEVCYSSVGFYFEPLPPAIAR